MSETKTGTTRQIVPDLSAIVAQALETEPPGFPLDWQVFMTVMPNPSAPAGLISVPCLHVATPTVTVEDYWHSRTSLMPPGVSAERVLDTLGSALGALGAALDRERAGEPLEKVVDLAWSRG